MAGWAGSRTANAEQRLSEASKDSTTAGRAQSAQGAAQQQRRRRWWRGALVVYAALLAASHAWQAGGVGGSGADDASSDRRAGRDPDEPALPYIEFETIDTLGRMEGAPPGRWPETTRFAYHFWPKDPAVEEGEAKPGLKVLRGPILYLHGAPGRGGDAEKIARHLNARGYDVYAPDLLGFGQTTNHPPDCSFEANAIACLRLMESLGLDEVHVVAHSQGGGIAIHMADMAGSEEPWRELGVPTATLMGAIGAQETEGSGSYAFEQARYELGSILVWTVRNAIPHFGLIGTPPRGFLRAFADSDQRPLRGMMERMTVTRVLILHGRHDFLVPPWAAEMHERFLPNAWLVMTPHSHFMPFIDEQAAEAAGWIDEFCRGYAARTKNEARPPEWWDWPRNQDFAPISASQDALFTYCYSAFHAAVALPIVLCVVVRLLHPRLPLGLLSALVGCLVLDYGVAILAAWVADLGIAVLAVVCYLLLLPCYVRQAPIVPRFGQGVDYSNAALESRVLYRPFRQAFVASFVPGDHIPAIWAALVLRTRLLSALALLGVLAGRLVRVIAVGFVGTAAFVLVARPFEFPFLRQWSGGWASVVLGVVAAMAATWFVDHLLTRTGRRMLVAQLIRWSRYEFWPTWVLYLPLIPHWVVWTLKTGHPLAFTACNPGISHGGGLIGESKAELHERLCAGLDREGRSFDPLVNAASAVCPTFLLAADDSVRRTGRAAHDRKVAKARAAELFALIAEHPDVLRLPVVVKPDSGFRGFGFKLVRSEQDAEDYFRTMRSDVVVQPFHPGPHEAGVMWARPCSAHPPFSGGIFSITLKEQPVVIGDGEGTLRDLILTHPRYRLQARTFLARRGRDALRVPEAGERLQLAIAGNHCQGSLFRDGSHLITPELTAALERICKGFGGKAGEVDGGLLDFARLDIRCRSLEDLAAGKLDAWSIVELNGTSAESTNIYDPDRSLLWAWKRLFAQWSVLYALGGGRMKQGHRPLAVLPLFAQMWRFYRKRTGSAVAD